MPRGVHALHLLNGAFWVSPTTFTNVLIDEFRQTYERHRPAIEAGVVPMHRQLRNESCTHY
eukprot:m.1482896 g.1482896  ORF g.1482896 m.1482896 type:complete len:61 (-) comp25178_c0_seq74:4985-5167(-)